ncbi:hypothetical protein PMAYCL1PPCAC_12884, partial [Pristionchus mayeri]
MSLLLRLFTFGFLFVEITGLLSNKDKIACFGKVMNKADKETDKVLKKKIDQTLETITDVGLEVMGMTDEQMDRIINHYFTGQCIDMRSFFACVPPLTAKLDAETDEGLKMAINAGLGKYTEGDIEGAKAIVAGMSDGQKERYRDHYLVDEMLRSTVLLVLSLAAIHAALTPEEEKCVPPLSAKMEAEPDADFKASLSTALGKYIVSEVQK